MLAPRSPIPGWSCENKFLLLMSYAVYGSWLQQQNQDRGRGASGPPGAAVRLQEESRETPGATGTRGPSCVENQISLPLSVT